MSYPNDGSQDQPYGQFRPDRGLNGDEGRPWPVYGGGANANETASQYSTQGPFPSVPAGQNMPSRTGAIWTLIGGLVTMFLVAPILFFGLVLGPIFAFGGAATLQRATQGSQVIVDDSGAIAVLTTEGAGVESCVLSQGGQDVTMSLNSTYGFVIGENVVPGEYTLTCQPDEVTDFVVVPGSVLQSIISDVGSALIWSTLVGLFGVALTIGGIVWLVRRNRARREAIRGNWGYPG